MLALIFGITVLFQSCDFLSHDKSKELFENPYTLKTQKVFSEISTAVFGNIAKGLKNLPYQTVSREDILHFANEGYKQWAKDNGAQLDAFNKGFRTARLKASNHIKQGRSTQKSNLSAFKNLYKKEGLGEEQIKYVLELREILGDFSNIANLERKLNKFDAKVYEQLGTEKSKPVLKISALMQTSTGFLLKDAEKLIKLAALVEANKERSSFYNRINLLEHNPNIFYLAQAQTEPIDPPDAREYFNEWEVWRNMFMGAVGGGLGGAGLGSVVPFIGTLFGGIFFGVIGGVGGGVGTFMSQWEEYSTAVGKWCSDAINYSHHDYERMCTGENDHTSDVPQIN